MFTVVWTIALVVVVDEEAFEILFLSNRKRDECFIIHYLAFLNTVGPQPTNVRATTVSDLRPSSTKVKLLIILHVHSEFEILSI